MKGKIEIREIQDSDIKTLTDLILRQKRLNEEFDSNFEVSGNWESDAVHHLKSVVSDRNENVALVATSSGKSVGIIIVNLRRRRFYKPESEGRITDFYIMPEFRRSGVGRMLYDKAVSELKKRSVELITAEFPTLNLIALNFYKKLGFRELVGIYGRNLE
ncbi:MAG TPA: GNAT family N-acetyltransferase [Thermoplasmataceae archaeon]|nr:GNAT family N-acetyltransferase [Thermoplasmatales archaeon AK]HLH86451.1 GNAT family N-acetyltransferase [Thermoplasmataceae archaeon]